MKLSFPGAAIGFLYSILAPLSSVFAAETSAPPANIEYVPVSQAWTLARHPTLPVLYVGCYGAPESKNLMTFRLNENGSILTNGQKVYDNYLSVNGTNAEFRYRILPRPVVLPKENVLVLACSPDSHGPYFAQTNNNECAVLALDGQGEATKLLKALRTSYTAREPLMAARADPLTQRLYLAYYVYFGWCELGTNGLPVSGQFVPISCPINQWYWQYVPAWQRFFTMAPAPGLNIFRTTSDGHTLDMLQYTTTLDGTPLSGNLQVSETFRKVYLLGLTPQKELTVFSLTQEGRLTGLPRYFSTGPASLIRFDFKAKKLYAIARDWMKVFALDKDGFPLAQPSLHSLACGVVNDGLVDENNGKLYMACTDPPKAKP